MQCVRQSNYSTASNGCIRVQTTQKHFIFELNRSRTGLKSTLCSFFFFYGRKKVPTDALFCPPLSGDSMRQASGEFAEDPCSSVKRGNMVRAARALLSAVTHLLVLADMSDVYKLLVQLKLVS